MLHPGFRLPVPSEPGALHNTRLPARGRRVRSRMTLAGYFVVSASAPETGTTADFRPILLQMA